MKWKDHSEENLKIILSSMKKMEIQPRIYRTGQGLVVILSKSF
jgi:hypothetical protein